MKRRKKRAARKYSPRWFEEHWNQALKYGSKPVLAEALTGLCVQNRKLAKHVRCLEEAIEEMQAYMHSRLHHLGQGLSQLEENQTNLTELVAVSPLQISDLPRWLKNDGLVNVKGTPHLRECAKVKDAGADKCTCGSVPSKRSN